MLKEKEAEKNRIKEELKDKSYLELFKELKKIARSHKDSLRELAIKELLDEKLKTLSLEELDEFSAYLESDLEKAKKYSKKTREELLTPEKIKEKSKKPTEEGLNYMRLIVADPKTLTEEEKSLLENEVKKAKIIEADKDSELLEDYLSEIKKQNSSKRRKL